MSKFPFARQVFVFCACACAQGAVPPEKNELFVWGNTGFQLTPTRPVVAIAAGERSYFAIQDDGVVSQWGEPRGRPAAGIRGARKIVVAGEWGVVALMPDGTLRSNRKGLEAARGVMDLDGRNERIAIVDSHHVAITYDGTWKDTVQGVIDVACTQDNAWYLRDDGVVLKGKTPQPQLGTFRKLTAGHWHVAGVRPDSTVKVWGDSLYKQASVPSGLAGVVDLQAGWCHTTALRRDGTVATWGLACPRAFECPVSLGVTPPIGGSETSPCTRPYPNATVAQPPKAMGKVRSIAAGSTHSLALLEDGQILAWGDTTYYASHSAQMPEGRADVAQVGAVQEFVAVLHKNGTLSLGAIPGGNLRWSTTPPANARRLKTISVGLERVFGLDSSGGVHAWASDGSTLEFPKKYVSTEGDSLPFPTTGIQSISRDSKLALLTGDGKVLVQGATGIFQEAAAETRNARQVEAGADAVFVLKKDGTVLMLAPDASVLPEAIGWSGIRRLFGSMSCMAAQDSLGALFLNGASVTIDRWSARPSGPASLQSFPTLASLDAEAYGLVALDTAGRLVSWGENQGPMALPAEAPLLKSVASGFYYGFGAIDRGPLYSSTESGPKRRIPTDSHQPGTYPVQVFDPQGNRLWEGRAEWTGSRWNLPAVHRQGLVVLRARLPSGTRSRSLLLAP